LYCIILGEIFFVAQEAIVNKKISWSLKKEALNSGHYLGKILILRKQYKKFLRNKSQRNSENRLISSESIRKVQENIGTLLPSSLYRGKQPS
jgi:hypothetical protein